MTYVHRKLQFLKRPKSLYMEPRSKKQKEDQRTRRARRFDALAAAKEKGERPAYQAFIDLCGATSDIVLWLEVEEPEFAESMPIKHTGFLDDAGVLTNGPSDLYRAYSAALPDDTARAQWAAQRKGALDYQWELLSEYPAYWWLSRQPGWERVFSTLRQKSRRSILTYGHGLARFRLVRVVSLAVGAYIWRKQESWKPNVPASRANIAKALRHIRALLKLEELGVVFTSEETGMFAIDFSIVEDALNDKLKRITRKERTDATVLERHFLRDVTRELEEVFGEASPTLIGHIASIAGYDMPDTTLRRVRAPTRTTQK
jgi:hypothetical protein